MRKNRTALRRGSVKAFCALAALTLSLCGCTRGRGASTGSDLTQAEIDRIVEEMEQAEAGNQ